MAPILFEKFWAFEKMWEPQSNIEEKDNSGILKDDFCSRTDPTILTSITPVLLN